MKYVAPWAAIVRLHNFKVADWPDLLTMTDEFSGYLHAGNPKAKVNIDHQCDLCGTGCSDNSLLGIIFTCRRHAPPTNQNYHITRSLLACIHDAHLIYEFMIHVCMRHVCILCAPKCENIWIVALVCGSWVRIEKWNKDFPELFHGKLEESQQTTGGRGRPAKKTAKALKAAQRLQSDN